MDRMYDSYTSTVGQYAGVYDSYTSTSTVGEYRTYPLGCGVPEWAEGVVPRFVCLCAPVTGSHISDRASCCWLFILRQKKYAGYHDHAEAAYHSRLLRSNLLPYARST